MVAVALSPQVKEIPLSLAPPVSAEEHIANLKAAARGSPDGLAAGSAVNGHNSDAYLPPREVARSIPCRFYPNCHYREKCIFYHPPPVNVNDEAALQHQQPVAGNGSANGYPASAQSPTNGYDAGQYMQQQQQQGFYGGYDAQQQQQNAEYMHYLAATQQQHGYLPPHLQHQQAAFYAYPGQQQQQQTQQSQQSNGYGQHQPQYQAYYLPQQGMYASIPPSMYPQHIYPGMSPPSQSFEQPLSPTSPTSPAPVNGNDATTDPAIISQSPRNSAIHPSSSSDAPKSASSPVDADGEVNGSAHADQAAQNNGTSTTSPHLANPPAVNGAYYPVAPIPMPLEALQAHFGNYSTPQQANGDAQAQLEADFARASLNGNSSSAENGESSSSNKKHERTQSAQMKTLYQTGSVESSTSSSVAGNAEAQTFVPGAVSPAAAPTNALSASTARLPIHTGPRMHEALNGNFQAGHRRDLSSSSALSSSKGPRPFGPSSSSASRPTGVAPQRNGPPRPFDPNRPVSQCRYFSDGGCRFGDSCFFSHTLRKALPVPGATDGRTTFDAKALKANIGDPDGNLNTMKLRPPGKTPFSTPANVVNGVNGSWNGAQRLQQHSPNANNAPLASGAAQTNGTEQHSAKDSQAIAASTEEQLQKLISEMPRQLNGSSAAPAPSSKLMPVPAVNGQSATAAPRSAIPATLGHRPPTAPRHQHHQQNGLHPHHPQQQQRRTSSQRIPSGENDFPALHNGATGSSTSRERSSSASGRSVADVVAAPAPAPALAQVAANKAVEQKPSSSTEAATEPKAESATPAPSTAAPAAASSAPPAAEKAQPTQAPTPALAPTKAAAPVSWASRAAQAASLPDPPKSKARPAPAASAAQKSAKGEKKEKAQSMEAGKKDTNSKEADLPAGQPTMPDVAVAAVPAVAA